MNVNFRPKPSARGDGEGNNARWEENGCGRNIVAIPGCTSSLQVSPARDPCGCHFDQGRRPRGEGSQTRHNAFGVPDIWPRMDDTPDSRPDVSASLRCAAKAQHLVFLASIFGCGRRPRRTRHDKAGNGLTAPANVTRTPNLNDTGISLDSEAVCMYDMYATIRLASRLNRKR